MLKPAVLKEEIAQRFVDRLCASIPYNVNIMDPEGVIIACRDSYRKGTYHDIAHRIVAGDLRELVVREDDPRPGGVLPGVNLPVLHHREVIGVVGLTGDPDQVRVVAYSVKTALETMVEYEEFKEQLARRQDRKRLLVTMLLYDDGVAPEDLDVLARHLGYRSDLFRIALVLPGAEGISERDFRKIVRSNELHTDQDMTLFASRGSPVIFRAVCSDSSRARGGKRSVTDYLAGLDEAHRRWGAPVPAWYAAGTVQTSLAAYRRSFHHALWVSGAGQAGRERYRFFADHARDYLFSLVPPEEIRGITLPLREFCGADSLAAFRGTFQALLAANMNIKEAAARLDVHRNTVMHRLERFQEHSGFDPLRSPQDRRLLELLYQGEL
ncbi:hypothetical protein AU468_11395 [Alkalispirochaeta sphaeroplastigenens]|uniref:Sugar diacid utilization regulator n=1 Tax=Alkalispirochaeta sphaeroplastigenens TaxID=1187066 RepID=A0A2S4JHF6_9SPIO|nr:sugar diacid recognition domain-containing protein [Alkalispirochaeta sphaeroplastigenens]POQ98987.1 hypothetical protein AU468_11395 [Alkalispirochaeta sphaeroplastigenens]